MLKFPTFWFDATPQGKFMLNIAFGQSKYYVDNLSENVKRGLRQKVRRGEAVGVAPTGYLNDVINHKMVKDPERFRLVHKLFQMYATGGHSLKGLREIIFDIGLVSRNGKKLSISNIQKILTNPLYYEGLLFNGELFPGTHEPCVSKKLFDTVQSVLTSKTCPKKRGEKIFPLRGLFRCAECNCSITAEMKKGHSYYRCTKKKDGIKCSQKYVREELLTEQVNEIIKKVSLPKNLTDKIIEQWERDEKDHVQSDAIFAEKRKLKIQALDDKLDALLDAHLDKALTRDEYTVKKNKVLSEKMDFEQELKDFERRGSGWLELSQRFFFLCNEAENVAEDTNIFKKIDFLKKLGSNRLIEDRRVKMELIQPWSFAFDCKQNGGLNRWGVKNENTPEGSEIDEIFFLLGVLNDLRTFDWLDVVQYPDHFKQQVTAVIAA